MGVTAITVTAAGGGGGSGGSVFGVGYPAGLGGLIVATVPVTPLSTLFVNVGGAGNYGLGTNSGGYNGGGNASVWYNSWYYNVGGGGGGASDVRTVEDSVAGSLDSRIVIAGGGGGTKRHRNTHSNMPCVKFDDDLFSCCCQYMYNFFPFFPH